MLPTSGAFLAFDKLRLTYGLVEMEPQAFYYRSGSHRQPTQRANVTVDERYTRHDEREGRCCNLCVQRVRRCVGATVIIRSHPVHAFVFNHDIHVQPHQYDFFALSSLLARVEFSGFD